MHASLYYPSIEFRSDDFIKKSLLVWDRIYRIVPKSYIPQDEQSIRVAVQEGAIQDVNVDSLEKSRAADGFLDFYAARQGKSALSWPAGLDSESFVRINPEKIEARLLPLFEQLAARTARDDGFMRVPRHLAGGYMFYLAESVARRRNLHLLSDSPDTWAVGSYFAQAGNFSDAVYDEGATAFLCNLAVTDLLPDTLAGVRMDEVLRFTERHSQQRAAFQDELKKLSNEISRCNNKEHARHIVCSSVVAFEAQKAEYRRAIGPFAKRELCSLLSSGISATLGILSLPVVGGVDPYGAIQISSSLLLGAVSALATRELIPVDKGTGSYLVSIDKLSATPNRQLHRVFEEFVND